MPENKFDLNKTLNAAKLYTKIDYGDLYIPNILDVQQTSKNFEDWRKSQGYKTVQEKTEEAMARMPEDINSEDVYDWYNAYQPDPKKQAKFRQDGIKWSGWLSTVASLPFTAGMTGGWLPAIFTTASGIGGSYAGGTFGKYLDSKYGTNLTPWASFIGGVVGGWTGTKGLGETIGAVARRTNNPKIINYAESSPIVSPKLPRLIRKMGETPSKASTVDNNFVKGNTAILNQSQQSFLQDANIVNFTTDQGVIHHGKGNWNMADMFVFPRSLTKHLIKRNAFRSISPMDTFVQYEGPLSVRAGSVHRISGRPSNLDIRTYSSKKLKNLFNKQSADFNSKAKTALSKESDFTLGKHALDYAAEQNRILQRRFGRPLFKDMVYFSEQTGLPLPAVKIDDFNNIVKSGTFTAKNWDLTDQIDVTKDIVPFAKGDHNFRTMVYPRAPKLEWAYRTNAEKYINTYGDTGLNVLIKSAKPSSGVHTVGTVNTGDNIILFKQPFDRATVASRQFETIAPVRYSKLHTLTKNGKSRQFNVQVQDKAKGVPLKDADVSGVSNGAIDAVIRDINDSGYYFDFKLDHKGLPGNNIFYNPETKRFTIIDYSEVPTRSNNLSGQDAVNAFLESLRSKGINYPQQ